MLKVIKIQLPKAELQTLVDDRQPLIAFTTDEIGFPLRIEISIREHQPRGPIPRRRFP